MNSSKFASTFAPYAPPPDDPSPAPPSSSKAPVRPWFPAHESSQHAIPSYQSGDMPTFTDSLSGGLGAAEEAQGQQNQWETTYGMRVDILAIFAYLLGPISALTLLILETQNDYVRFHAYQSALLTTPLTLFRIFCSLIHFPSAFNICLTILILVAQLYMAFRAYRDASQNGLTRFHLPYIGLRADQWVSEE